MKILSNDDIKLMENLIKVNQESLQNVLYKFLKRSYKNVTYDKQFLLAEGDIPIALVAHMDTVFKKPAEELFYDRKKNVMWSPTGAGFDDRAGVFAIIKIIEAGFKPHIIFTTDEEKGCIGAYELSFLPQPFKDLRYIIQLDRRGANDCVFYDCDNEEFEKYIEQFGFVTNYGSFTDISELCPSWGIAGVNLSIGYRDEHTTSEILFVGHMLDTIEKVKVMLSQKEIPNFVYIPIKGNYYNFYDDDYDYNFGYNNNRTPGFIRYRCSGCGKVCDGYDVIEVKLIKGGKGFFCDDCIQHKIDWCWKCGAAFEIDENEPGCGFCKDCRKEIKKGKAK